jgi:hypothetical protein
VNPDDFRGPGFQSGYDPVWVDLLEKHADQPFHLLIGGGDQLYCDGCVVLLNFCVSGVGIVFQSHPGTRNAGMDKLPKYSVENGIPSITGDAVRDRPLFFQSLLPVIS